MFSLFKPLLISGKPSQGKKLRMRANNGMFGENIGPIMFLFCLIFSCLVFSFLFFTLCSLNGEEHRRPKRRSLARSVVPYFHHRLLGDCSLPSPLKVKVILVYLSSQLTCHKGHLSIWKLPSLVKKHHHAMDYIGRVAGDGVYGLWAVLTDGRRR